MATKFNGRLLVKVLMPLTVSCLAVACSSASPGSSGKSGALPSSITLAAVDDLTGVAGIPGTDTKYGMETAVDEINATHYLGSGVTLSVNYQDTGTIPATGAQLFSSDVAQTYPVIFGSVSSNLAIVEAPIAQKAKVPAVFTIAGSAQVIATGNYIYSATPQQAKYVSLDIAHLKAEHASTIAILSDTDLPTTVQIAATIAQMAQAAGIQVVDQEKTTSTTTDLSAEVSRLTAPHPDAIMMVVNGTQNATAVTQLKVNGGYKGMIFGLVGTGGGELNSIKPTGNGVMWATDFNAQAQQSGVQNFVAQFKKYQPQQSLSNFAAEGYDAVWFAARAIKAAGSVNRADVLKGMQKVAAQGYSGALGQITYSGRIASASGFLVQYENGVEELVK